MRKVIRFARIARAARGDDVGPVVGPAAREWNEVIAGERFTRLQFDLTATAILAAVAIPREEERVGDLPPESSRDVDELRQANDRRTR